MLKYLVDCSLQQLHKIIFLIHNQVFNSLNLIVIHLLSLKIFSSIPLQVIFIPKVRLYELNTPMLQENIYILDDLHKLQV